jgi:ABC-type dipeptide transport system, periplasmic component
MRTRLLGALLAVVLAVTACGGSGADGGDGTARLRMAIAAVPASLDPRTSSPYDALYVGLLYDSLIRRSPDGTFQPGLATEWAFSEDMRVLELTLRDGVRFQDGTEFDAAAVKANLDAALARPTNFTNHLSNLEGVDVVDPRHVRLRLSSPGVPLLGILSGEAGMIISPKALATPDLTQSPAGTGPFTLDQFVGTELSFTTWDGYWDAANIPLPGLDLTVFLDETARLRSLRSGQVDAAVIMPNQVAEARSAGLEVTGARTADFFGLILNTGKAEFAEPKVRRAMMQAIDRPALAKNLFGDGCYPTAQPFRPDDWAYAPGIDERPAARYDPARARQLLAEAGYADGFSFEIQTNTMNTWVQMATILQSQFRDIGITVELRPMENVQFVTARRNGEFEATLSTYQSARPDHSEFIKTFYLPGGLFNPGGYDLPGVAELLAEVTSNTDPQAREAAVHEIMTAILDDGPPVLPICTRTTYYAHRAGVHGLTVSPMFDPNLAWVTVDAR